MLCYGLQQAAENPGDDQKYRRKTEALSSICHGAEAFPSVQMVETFQDERALFVACAMRMLLSFQSPTIFGLSRGASRMTTGQYQRFQGPL